LECAESTPSTRKNKVFHIPKPICKCTDNIKMDLGEKRWGGVDWIDLAQDRDLWRALVNMVMNLWVP
jgi:hypothetical protein